MAADLEFFFDPVCPWAWITSRWVVDVSDQRHYQVDWRFISLWMLNEDNHQEWYTPQYRAGHYFGQQGLRIADAIRVAEDDPSGVGRFYTAFGAALHVGGQREAARRDALLWYRGCCRRPVSTRATSTPPTTSRTTSTSVPTPNSP